MGSQRGDRVSPSDPKASPPHLSEVLSATTSHSITAPSSTLCAAHSAPDGGLTAWLQVLSGYFLFFNCWGLVNAFGVFQTYFSAHLLVGVPNTQISWIGSLYSFLLAASPLIFGPVYDRGHPRFLVVSGSVLVVFGLMMTSICTTYWQLMLAQGVCLGIGGGCIFITTIATIPLYFSKRRALALGIAASARYAPSWAMAGPGSCNEQEGGSNFSDAVQGSQLHIPDKQTGSSVAGILYPIVFHQLQPRLGFPWAVRVIAFIALGTLSISCALLRPRIVKADKRRPPLFDLSILRDTAFEAFNLASFFGFVGQYVPFFYIEEYSIQHGISANLSFYMLAFLNVGSIFGRIIPGLFADKFSPLVVLAICTGCAAILGFCWIAITSTAAGLIIFCLLYGFFSGAFVSLQPASVAAMTKDLSTIGTRLGVNAFFAALGILIGNPVAGAIVPKSWAGTQAFCGFTLALSTLLLICTQVLLLRRGQTAEGKA